MGVSECGNALQAFIDVLGNYLEKKGRRTLSISLITGQKRVRIALRALIRCHEPSYGFVRVSDILSKLAECGITKRLSMKGLEVVFDRDDIYLIVDVDTLKKLVEIGKEGLKEYFKVTTQ